jgi:hypothetical protein
VLAALLLGVGPAAAHQLIDQTTAEAFLARLDAARAALEAAETDGARAEAHFEIGEARATIIEALNGDLAAHGGDLGLAPQALVVELKRRRVEPGFFEAAGRYRAPIEAFERALALAPDGPRAADAAFRILAGRFYDSFVYDPFQPIGLDWPDLESEIALAEEFLAHHVAHPGREEVEFILAVDYARAARTSHDKALAQRYAEQARVALAAFSESYPDSLRAAAARAMLDALDTAD